MTNNKKKFTDRWWPGIISCSLALITMLINRFTINSDRVYSLIMLLSTQLTFFLSLFFGKKQTINTVDTILNIVGTLAIIIILSFIFMVLPSIIEQ